MVSIGGIKIDTPLALAPMAGVTDLAFRTICREQGAGLTCTEMVSAKALCYQDKKSIPLLQLGDGESPAAAQIFGSDPVCMEEAAAQRCDTAVRQFELSAANKGEKIACLEARRHYAWYLKGVPHAGYYKEQIVKITTLEDVYRVTRGIKRDLC